MDTTCLLCGCGPHRTNPCARCGCRNFINAELAAARTIVEGLPQLATLFIDAVAILSEAFPEAVKAVDARREAYRKQLEEEAKNAKEGNGSPAPGSHPPEGGAASGDSGATAGVPGDPVYSASDNDAFRTGPV